MRFSLALCAFALASVPVSLTAAAAPIPSLPNNPYPALRIMDARVANIGYRLTRENADWCRGRRYDDGLRISETNAYPKSGRALALAAYDVPAGFTGSFVSAVVPESLAAESGARVGANGAGLAWADSHARLHCIADISVRASDGYYAATDGLAIQISAALIQQTRDDDELAAIIAHELSHIILDHPSSLKRQRNTARVRQTERDADQLSVWLMARAGYDSQAAVRFWTHYGPRRGAGILGGIFNAPTHDNWKIRVARLTSEIQAMEAARSKSPDALPTITGLRTYP